MAKFYEFCVTRISANNKEILRVRLKYGEIKPTKEVAKVIVSQRLKQPTTQSISVSDYIEEKCPGESIEEITIKLSGEQLDRLVGAIGRADPVGVGVAVGEIVVGVGAETAEAGKKVVRFIERVFGVKF